MRLSETRFLVIDTETTGLDPNVDKVVEIAVIHVESGFVRGIPFADFVNPEMPIPPEASAVHHITTLDVVDAPKIDAVRSIVEHITEGAVVAAHNAAFDNSMFPLDKTWLCTYRLARHLYPELKQHTNQYLRYYFGLEFGVWTDDVKTKAHRAYADAIITGHLLVKMLNDYVSLGYVDDDIALLEFANGPIKVETMPFGKHKGTAVSDVPTDYFQWMLRNMKDLDADLRWTVESEMQRRGA